jgi:hypothetical protein
MDWLADDVEEVVDPERSIRELAADCSRLVRCCCRTWLRDGCALSVVRVSQSHDLQALYVKWARQGKRADVTATVHALQTLNRQAVSAADVLAATAARHVRGVE